MKHAVLVRVAFVLVMLGTVIAVGAGWPSGARECHPSDSSAESTSARRSFELPASTHATTFPVRCAMSRSGAALPTTNGFA